MIRKARVYEVARQLAEGTTWDSPEEAFTGHGLTPEEQDAVCAHIAGTRLLPRPGDGSDQPTIPVDAEGWGYTIPKGTCQPSLF